MTPNIEIVVGTYEEFLVGYKLESKDGKEVLSQSFADKSHSGALRCVAVQNHWIATGASDDRIFIYDMRTRKQTQILLSHDGTVNALAFTPDATHLLSGGDDGRMIATRLETWFVEGNWKKAHNGSAVTHISCHPSGKLALSLGMDFVLRTWNLVKGRIAYQKNLKSKSSNRCALECLAWSPGGDYFTLGGARAIEIWSIKTAEVVRTQKTNSKPVSVCWISDEVCLVGLEDGKILWVTVNDEPEAVSEAHSSRVKAMSFHKGILVTATSSGEIKMFEVAESERNLKEMAATNIGCRPTCIGILDLEQFGSDYKVSNAVPAREEVIKPKKETKVPERGVVTIEYENADEDAPSESESDESEGNEQIAEPGAEADTDSDSEQRVSEHSDSEQSDSESEETPTAPTVTKASKRKNKAAKYSQLKRSKVAHNTETQVAKKPFLGQKNKQKNMLNKKRKQKQTK